MRARRLECPCERETLAALQAGRWPDCCDDATREHACACEVCRDLLLIASTLAADFQHGVRSAHVPASGLVWWRMQRRARQEAARATARAITVVQAICVGGGVIAAIILARVFGFSLSAALASSGFAPAAGFAHGAGLTAALAQWTLPLLIALASWLALAPVAFYLAVSRD
jgi:hypothetical protein